MNRQKVVCASPMPPQDYPISCNEDNLIVTMLGGVDPQNFISDVNSGLSNRDGDHGRQFGAIVTSPNGRMMGLEVAYFLAELSEIPRCSFVPIGTKCRP